MVKYLLLLFSLLILLFIPRTLPAQPYKEIIKEKAIKNGLHEASAWLALVHYRKPPFSSSFRSEADHSSFFFSPDGPSNPKSELLATIEAMFLPQKMANEHPQCIFPARFYWLKNSLDIASSSLPVPDCGALQAWREKLNVDQATLVFPTTYLNNPSSMFGHAFLRLELPGRSENKVLMAPTINFAADTSLQKGKIDYMLRGVFGGFPSRNSVQYFYRRFKRYADYESRDIWEYKLNFVQDELELLVLHVWELRNNIFDYYFLDENCVYRLLALLEVGRPSLKLTKSFSAYTIPSDVIRSLRDRGLVKSINYRASYVKEFQRYIKNLTEEEKSIIIDIVRNQLPLDNNRVASLQDERKGLILSLSSKYLDILINKDIIDRKYSKQLTYKLLKERGKYSVPVAFDKIGRPAVSPDGGHKSKRISIASGLNNNYNIIYRIGYRGAYHGLTDPLPGFEKGAQVELLNIELRGYENDSMKLDKLDLINVKSLAPFDRFFTPLSWRFSLGMERVEFYDKDQLLSDIDGGMGITFNLAGFMLSSMVHLALDFGSALDEGYGFGSGLYLSAVYQGEMISCDIGGMTMKYLVGDSDSLTKLWSRISFPADRNNAIFTEIEYFPNTRNGLYDVSIGVHHYF